MSINNTELIALTKSTLEDKFVDSPRKEVGQV